MGVFLVALLALPAAGASAAPEPKGTDEGKPRGGPPQIDARAWILIDGRTGEALAARDPKRHLPIASTTKLMTAYLALAELPLEKRVKMQPYAAIPGESLLGVAPGTTISVRDLLYGLILRSGNDAAYTLAEAVAGSEKKFVRQMNERAAALGLADTHYANPIGLDEKGNYSSAADLTTLARRLLQIPVFARIADSRDETLDSLKPPVYITTRNTLLLSDPNATGVKTGHTIGAGYVLVASGTEKGTKLISAVLGAPSEYARDADSQMLLDYGFSKYTRKRAVRGGRILARPSIRWSGGELPLRAVPSATIGLRSGQHLSVRVKAPDEVEGPIRRGAKLGTATVYVDGRVADEIPLAATRSVDKATTAEKVRSQVEDHLLLIIVALCAILLLAVAFSRFWRGRRERGDDDDMTQSAELKRRVEIERQAAAAIAAAEAEEAQRTDRDARRAEREERRRDREDGDLT